jgi:hypothetical protein
MFFNRQWRRQRHPQHVALFFLPLFSSIFFLNFFF